MENLPWKAAYSLAGTNLECIDAFRRTEGFSYVDVPALHVRKLGKAIPFPWF